jgi:hypothetical protein
MARGRHVFPILGNRHPRPFGNKYRRTGGAFTRYLKQELTMPEASEPLVQLAGSERAPLPGAAPAGRLDTAERAELTLVLRRRAEIPADIVEGPTVLTGDQLAERYGADPADVNLVRRTLTGLGLEITAVHPASRRIKVAGPLGQLSGVFGAELRQVSRPPRQPHVDFPASSPHALACGGTKLLADAATGVISSEVVWPDPDAPVLRGSAGHPGVRLPRHHQREQRRLRGRTRLGCLLGPGQPRRHRAAEPPPGLGAAALGRQDGGMAVAGAAAFPVREKQVRTRVAFRELAAGRPAGRQDAAPRRNAGVVLLLA